MARSFLRPDGLFRSSLSLRVLLAGLLLSNCPFERTATAQQPPAPISGLSSTVPPVPVKPGSRPEEAIGFIKGQTTNDAVIEIILGQSRILTLAEDLRTATTAGSIAVGDPTVLLFNALPAPAGKQPNQIRLVGGRLGITDLVIESAAGHIFSYEVRVVADLDVLRAELRALYPDASLVLSQVRDNVIVEGQARSTAQVARILETIQGYLRSIQNAQVRRQGSRAGRIPLSRPGEGAGEPVKPPEGAKPEEVRPPEALPGGPDAETPAMGNLEGRVTPPTLINLIRVMGAQQVLLKVRVAEMNRTAMREIGADFLSFDHASPLAVGTGLGNSNISAAGSFSSLNNAGSFGITAAGSNVPGTTTAFGIFNRGDFEVFVSALRKNNLLKILAEPNLVALNGQRANFLAGGQFFIPTAQTAIGGVAGGISATPVNFGVSLDFLAHILDDGVIRLTVDPEVSQPDFTVATTLVAGGSPVPGLNTRRAHTTVELHQGQTLAIAGLMSVTLDGATTRIPGLGDLPILGTFFSNTTGSRTEKELVVLVTPYLVEPMNPDQVPPSPGDEVKEPNDLEFYLLGRIEGRTGVDFRSTTHYDDATHVVRCLLRLHDENVRGPKGYCE